MSDIKFITKGYKVPLILELEVDGTNVTYRQDDGVIHFTVWVGDAEKALKQQEIVHCCECVYRYVEGKKVRFNRCKLDHNSMQSDDWYCADAERRTDGETT